MFVVMVRNIGVRLMGLMIMNSVVNVVNSLVID